MCFMPGGPRTFRVGHNFLNHCSRAKPPDRTFELRRQRSPARRDSLEDMENVPPPHVIAQEIVEDLEAALAEFAAIAASLAPPDPPAHEAD